jgi:hypothetical protein
MSIRSTIGTILPSGLLQVIFIDRGGLPTQVGAFLNKCFHEQADVEALLNLGDVQEIVDSLPEDLALSDSLVELDEHIPQLNFYQDLELWLNDAKQCSYAYLFKDGQLKSYERVFLPQDTSPIKDIWPGRKFITYWVDENQSRIGKTSIRALYPIKVTGSDGKLPTDYDF